MAAEKEGREEEEEKKRVESIGRRWGRSGGGLLTEKKEVEERSGKRVEKQELDVHLSWTSLHFLVNPPPSGGGNQPTNLPTPLSVTP